MALNGFGWVIASWFQRDRDRALRMQAVGLGWMILASTLS